jgi:hypothetical protein
VTDEIKQHVARLREDANRNIATGEHSESDYGVLAVCTALEQAEADGTEYVKEIRDLTIRCQQAEAALQGRTVSCVCGGEDGKRLALAEEILSDLATGFWVSVLDDCDGPVAEKMGQRVLKYWRCCGGGEGGRAKRDAAVLEWAANRMASLALHDLVEPIRRGEVVIS